MIPTYKRNNSNKEIRIPIRNTVSARLLLLAAVLISSSTDKASAAGAAAAGGGRDDEARDVRLRPRPAGHRHRLHILCKLVNHKKTGANLTVFHYNTTHAR